MGDTADVGARVKVLAPMFLAYQDTDKSRMQMYVMETAEIPIDKLAIAVQALIRTHRWPRLPSIADLWALAKEAAGMNRERYHAGRYVPPTTEWPPAGQRYAVQLHELEAAPTPERLQLPVSMQPLRIGGGE